jgi:hypothetical protein
MLTRKFVIRPLILGSLLLVATSSASASSWGRGARAVPAYVLPGQPAPNPAARALRQARRFIVRTDVRRVWMGRLPLGPVARWLIYAKFLHHAPLSPHAEPRQDVLW